jgi:hypothetical protein
MVEADVPGVLMLGVARNGLALAGSSRSGGI